MSGTVSQLSVLQRTPRLVDVIDLLSFRDLCRSFSELYGVGIKVFDASGEKLVDFRAQTIDYCGLMFEHYETKVACTNLVGQIRSMDVEDAGPTGVPVQCFSGLRYRIAALMHEGDMLGRVIYGPFRPDTLTRPPDLVQLAKELPAPKAETLLANIRPVADRAIDTIVTHCQQVIDSLIFAGFKAHITSAMHIESVTMAYRELEEQNLKLHTANDKLREADRVKSNFVATVSHELRTPLTSVIGYSEMLLEGMAGVMNDEQREYVGTIMEKGESLLSLITSILDLSKIESGNFTMHRSSTDIEQLFGRALSDVTPQTVKKKITLQKRVAAGLGRFVIDEEKVHRAVTNLLANAVKFTPEGGTVSLIVDKFEGTLPEETGHVYDPFIAENNRWLRVSVRDTGIGIAPEKRRKVFEPFYQVDSSSTREYGGTGLGLAIVKNFVEAHGGVVWLESEPGKGSMFHFVIPWLSRAA